MRTIEYAPHQGTEIYRLITSAAFAAPTTRARKAPRPPQRSLVTNSVAIALRTADTNTAMRQPSQVRQ